MQQGNAVGNSEGPFRACCIIQCSPSQEPLAHSPALSTHRLGWVPVFTPGQPRVPRVGSPGQQTPFSPHPLSLGR